MILDQKVLLQGKDAPVEQVTHSHRNKLFLHRDFTFDDDVWNLHFRATTAKRPSDSKLSFRAFPSSVKDDVKEFIARDCWGADLSNDTIISILSTLRQAIAFLEQRHENDFSPTNLSRADATAIEEHFTYLKDPYSQRRRVACIAQFAAFLRERHAGEPADFRPDPSTIPLTTNKGRSYSQGLEKVIPDEVSDALMEAIHRHGLMTDTFEQLIVLNDWMRDLARRLPNNVLLVIAGRIVPEWERSWQGWMGKAEIVELKEMAPENLCLLVDRYYAYIHGSKPNSTQVEAIAQFARGLPMAATTVVQLWVKYGKEDFQAVRPQVVADLVDRLLEGVPEALRPAFEAAAVLRYFNVDTLNMLLEDSNGEAWYAELRRWPFIRPRQEGLAVHDTMREMINEALYMRTPAHFQTLHERAARFYGARLEKTTGDKRERYILERLYHRLHVDEDSGMQLFQKLAEEFTSYRLVNRLRALLCDMNSYPLKQENSCLWRGYYNARLAHLEAQINSAEEMYQTIGENERVEPKLRAYALCDWGGILCRRERLYQPCIAEKAVHLLESSLKIGGSNDVKLAMSWAYLSDIYIAQTNWEKALFYLDQARTFFAERHDYSGLLNVLKYERGIYGRQGDLRKVFGVDQEMRDTYSAAGKPSYLSTYVAPSLDWMWAGRYAEVEKNFRAVSEAVGPIQDQEYQCWKTRDLALCLGLQGKCTEALAMAEEGLSLARDLGRIGELDVSLALSISGITCLKCGMLDRAEENLTQSLAEVPELVDAHREIALVSLATLYEALKAFDKAEHFYQLAHTEAHRLDRNYFECGALTGMIRVRYAQNNSTAIPPLWTEAKRLAQKYEYNDYFTSLFLTRGHLTWDGLIPEWESGFDSALRHYQHALIYALRYNRFLLDEALSGREQGLPLRPIILHCLEHGEEGQHMLIALRDWWQSGINDIGTSRPDTISPFPESILLLEAERIARQREPGDGSSQKDVGEQIDAALTMANGEERLSL